MEYVRLHQLLAAVYFKCITLAPKQPLRQKGTLNTKDDPALREGFSDPDTVSELAPPPFFTHFQLLPLSDAAAALDH